MADEVKYVDTGDCRPPAPLTLIGAAENMKLLLDRQMQDLLGKASYPNAWEQIALSMAHNAVNLSNRVANNTASFDHAVNMGSLISAQAGDTQAQQTVSPIKLGAADTQNQQPAGAVYPPIRNVDQGGASATNAIQNAIAGVAAAVTESVQTNVTAQLGTLTTQVVTLAQQLSDSNATITALLAQLVQNAKQAAPGTPTA